MILCDRDLKSIGEMLLTPYDESLVNPASIDIRVGANAIYEANINHWVDCNITDTNKENPFIIKPHMFVLVETLEVMRVPNGYAVECKLKSTLARGGLNHSLAFWFDPGWIGVGTLELHNVSMFQDIRIWYGRPIVQIIVHRLSGDAERPYAGRYQGAKRVELAKP